MKSSNRTAGRQQLHIAATDSAFESLSENHNDITTDNMMSSSICTAAARIACLNRSVLQNQQRDISLLRSRLAM
jgi:hypothetical protein